MTPHRAAPAGVVTAAIRSAAPRAHLLAAAGRAEDARRQYAVAAALASNGAERRWFVQRAG